MAENLASSRRVQLVGHSAENRAQKNKKSAARGSERTPVGKLNKKVVPVYQDLVYPLIGQF